MLELVLTANDLRPQTIEVNIGKSIEIFMTHNQLVFGITLAIIFGLFSLLLYRLFFQNDDEAAHTASSADVGQIEETLKKILNQTALTGAATVAPPEVEKMRTELETSQQMINDLKKKMQENPADNTPELLGKIKVLEDRLAEYEIIEDDIADLSVYKEENAKLKRQLEAIKSGESSPMVEEFAVAVENAPVGTELRGESVEEAVAAAETLMGETAEPTTLDEAVEAALGGAQDTAKAFAPGSPAAAAAAAAPPAEASEPAPFNEPASTEDVFAEFQGDENKDLLSELGDIDADRMLEEIKDLGEGMSADANVLDEEVDLEKMAKESAKG